MNTQNIRPDIDLESAEQTVMGRAGPAPAKKSAVVDPMDLYTRELNELADELGIDFLDGDAGGTRTAVDSPKHSTLAPVSGGVAGGANNATSNRPPNGLRNPLGNRSIDALLGSLDLGSDSDNGSASSSATDDEDTSEGSDDEDTSEDTSEASDDEDTSEASGDDASSDEDADSDASADSVVARLEKGLGIDLDATRRKSKRRLRIHDTAAGVTAGVAADSRRSRLSHLTEEQERRRHINSVMGDMRRETRTSFGIEYERVQDAKTSKLEQISQLRQTLVEEGVDCSGVGVPTMDSPMEEIDSVLGILKTKNDRNRYSTLAEEIILGAAEGIETVFDGTREIPVVGWKPDYTGYHNTVMVKLHRMRFETSQVVGNVIEKYNIGPTTRIIMELLPSFFLYPRQQKKQKGTPGLHADFGGGAATSRGSQVPQVHDARRAYARIRASDNVQNLDDVRGI